MCKYWCGNNVPWLSWPFWGQSGIVGRFAQPYPSSATVAQRRRRSLTDTRAQQEVWGQRRVSLSALRPHTPTQSKQAENSPHCSPLSGAAHMKGGRLDAPLSPTDLSGDFPDFLFLFVFYKGAKILKKQLSESAWARGKRFSASTLKTSVILIFSRESFSLGPVEAKTWILKPALKRMKAEKKDKQKKQTVVFKCSPLTLHSACKTSVLQSAKCPLPPTLVFAVCCWTDCSAATCCLFSVNAPCVRFYEGSFGRIVSPFIYFFKYKKKRIFKMFDGKLATIPLKREKLGNNDNILHRDLKSK